MQMTNHHGWNRIRLLLLPILCSIIGQMDSQSHIEEGTRFQSFLPSLGKYVDHFRLIFQTYDIHFQIFLIYFFFFIYLFTPPLIAAKLCESSQVTYLS